MNTQAIASTHQSRATAAGGWTLAPQRAMSLRPTRNGLLRVRSGRAWVTVERPDQAAADVVLEAGQAVLVRAGHTAVMESWSAAEAVRFDWQPWQRYASARAAWRTAVGQPLAELGAALAQAARALGRLAGGVAGLASGRL
ncbi:MAG TPA: DUF2917 domain-containing protein [Ramlibacter sp.]|nr:DUF2917 domain-containing protein [Ramlibacter sp.]